MNEKKCCNNECEQGRFCPNRQALNIAPILFKYYLTLPSALAIIAVGSLFF